MKVLIIGLDGATWDVFDDYVLDNYMPKLKRLRAGGYSGLLRSTDPPVTPAAWTTCITGCQPYTHGVLGFKDYSFDDDRLRISSASSCQVPFIWEQLSKQGYKVASINVPWTYPCRQVNGVVIAGYGIPNTQVQFTYPAKLKGELLEKIPDYDVVANWQKAKSYTHELFDANLARVKRSFRQRVETARMLEDREGFDVMMVQFQDTDLVQHHVWPYLCRQTRDHYPWYRDRLFGTFEKLDEAIGDLVELCGDDNCTVAVVSDHGFGRMQGSIKANMLLHQWGYLRYKSPVGRMLRRLRRNLGAKKIRGEDSMSIELKSPVDWSRSKAMLMYAAMNGHVYLNVRGRNPHGFVERGPEYEGIIEELIQRFSEVRDPVSEKAVFSKVLRPAELYGCESSEAEMLGDLIIVAEPGYIVHQTTAREGEFIELQSKDSLAGCHYSEGIHIFNGSMLKSGEQGRQRILDFAPTVYALIGAEVPSYVDGRVMEKIFKDRPDVRYQKQQRIERGEKQDISEQEQDIIAKRLAELGYLD